MDKNYTQQDLNDDIYFFQSLAGCSPIYSLMALKSYYEHGKGLGVEENMEWLEMYAEVIKTIVKFLTKNVKDRAMRLEDDTVITKQ